MDAQSVFVSHISEEGEIAGLVKTMLQEDFLGNLKGFTSSDIGSIGAGENWLTAIERAMSEAKAVIVLCSKASVNRPCALQARATRWRRP